VAGPNGLSPVQEVMAEVGLTLTSARVVDLVPEPDQPISDRDWVQRLALALLLKHAPKQPCGGPSHCLRPLSIPAGPS
jgi:hypothetical protein